MARPWLRCLPVAFLFLLCACGSGSSPQTAGAPPPSAAPAGATASQAGTALPAALKGTIDEFGAGTLAGPFGALNKQLQSQAPGLTVQAQFGGSVAMVKQVTELGRNADVVAVADYNIIPPQMFAASGREAYANWYAGFASNAITLVYTDKSKGAGQITKDNWYQVLSQPGVQIGRSNPDTDPSGYQFLLMLKLAEQYYKQAGLSDKILANAPASNLRDTETDLLSALQTGQIDYLAIYRSDALQHKLKYLDLPPQINLSDPSMAATYKSVSVQTKNGTQTGGPIIYAVTVPTNAEHPNAGLAYVQALLGPEGQQTMKANGFVVLDPAIVAAGDAAPAALKALTKPWPAS